MAVQKAKSALFTKYGQRLDTAVKTHAADPVDYGRISIPPGINNGICKLVKCGFEQYKQGSNQKKADGSSAVGEYYFRAVGVIVEPASVNVNGVDVPVRGLQTSIMEAVCDTKGGPDGTITTDQHVYNILNHMKKLAGPEFVGEAGGAELEDLAKALEEHGGLYFRFRTSVKPEVRNPPPPAGDGAVKYAEGVWENWDGGKGLENYTPPEEDAVEDNTGGTAVMTKPALAKAPPGKKPPVKTAVAAPDPEPVDETAGDLDSLAETADGDDEGAAEVARESVKEAAVGLGWTEDQVVAWPESWTALVERLKAGEGPPEGDSDEPADADEGVDVGTVWNYQPLDPKTKKPATKLNTKTKKQEPLLVECEVKAVDKAKKTVTLLNLDDKKTKYQNVAFDALQGG